MTCDFNPSTPQNLHDLSWNYAQDGKVAFDAATETILDANPAMESLTGYSRAELIGMQATMLHPEAERELATAEFLKPMSQPMPHFDLHLRRKDGVCVPVAIWSSRKLKLADRTLVIGEFRDITANNDAVMHLAQMEARYRGLLEAAPDGMVVVNQAGEIVLLNARAETQFGYRRDELLGQKVTSIIPEGFAERLIADGARTAAEALAQQIGTGIELIGRRKDGSEFPIEIMLSPLENAEGVLVTAAIRDITLKREKEHQLLAQNWALSAYASAAMALASAHSSENLLKAVCEAITHESIYALAWVGIAEDGPGKRIRIAAAAGSAVRYLDGVQLSWSEDEKRGGSPTGICIRTGSAQITGDTQTSPAFALWSKRAMDFAIRSSISIPLRIEGGWNGALVVYAENPHAFEAPAIKVLEHLAEQIVHAVHALDQGQEIHTGQINLANTQRQLTDALSAMVKPMVSAMEMRDPYTAGHENRVADIAVAIGREMGWTEERLHGLYIAAQVHDIGKISIPAEILTKPTNLSAGEWALIREHPETGYTILKDIPFTWPIAEIVRQHHERLDGSGYPQGLKGAAILPESRIVAIADVVEAMVSNRPYRVGIPLDVVLEQIEKDAGTLLDAEAVRVCVSLFRDKHFTVLGWIRQ
jgi:PAS domain S-box-containing protein